MPEEIAMKFKTLTTTLMAGTAVACLVAGASLAQSGTALSGRVTSAEEGPMEGVLVSARKDGGNITVTVVSNEKGEYSFPAGRIEPGHYTIAIRAAGYDLDGPQAVDVASNGAKADVTLKKTKNLANQLTNAEWILSATGPENIK